MLSFMQKINLIRGKTDAATGKWNKNKRQKNLRLAQLAGAPLLNLTIISRLYKFLDIIFFELTDFAHLQTILYGHPLILAKKLSFLHYTSTILLRKIDVFQREFTSNTSTFTP